MISNQEKNLFEKRKDSISNENLLNAPKPEKKIPILIPEPLDLNDYSFENEEDDFNSQMEDEKNFSSKQSNIFKIEYIKKLIRKHYFDNFDNLKECFNNMCGDNDNYLNIEDIIFYLKV